MSRWGRRAALVYLVVCALALVAMLVETVLGHPGLGSMFAAILAVPWSMLMAGFAPPLPRDWPMAAGLAVRMVPLALFMLLNAAIIRGIAARSERDLARTATRASALLVLCAVLGSGCILSSRQETFMAAPSKKLIFFNGGMYREFTFDLTTSPQWRDQRSRIVSVRDLAIVGDFSNATGSIFGGDPEPIDVRIDVASDTLPALGVGTDVWGPIHVAIGERRRIDWSAGEQLVIAGAPALEREIRGDGLFTLFTITTTAIPTVGGVDVENLRLAAVFELK